MISNAMGTRNAWDLLQLAAPNVGHLSTRQSKLSGAARQVETAVGSWQLTAELTADNLCHV